MGAPSLRVGWDPGQPDLVEGVAAHGKGVGNGRALRSLPTQAIMLFCDSMIISLACIEVQRMLKITVVRLFRKFSVLLFKC